MRSLKIPLRHLFIAGILLSGFLQFLFVSNSFAAEEAAYWDKGNLYVNDFRDDLSVELECDYSIDESKSDVFTACIRDNSGINPEISDTLSKIRPSSFDFAEPGVRPNATANLGTENNIQISCDRHTDVYGEGFTNKCTVEFHAFVGSEFKARGFQNGQIIFISPDGKQRLYVNGVITDADDIEINPQIIGHTSLSWQENWFYHEMEKHYESTRDDFVENCQNNRGGGEDCEPTMERAYGSFTQIWRICVVATGMEREDVNNAVNCLRQHTGVSLKADDILANSLAGRLVAEDNLNCGLAPAGYILCPVMRFMASAADRMFQFMIKLLTVSPLDTNSASGQGARGAWTIFTRIANIIFIILLMIIIFSQLTGYGLDNYGIKRLLPRLIVGAILVNASFYICLVAIDISNILGAELQRVMVIINNEIFSDTNQLRQLSANMDAAPDGDNGWEATVNGILLAGVAAGGVVGAVTLVFTFIPVMTAVILAAITVVLVLIVRYGLILLLTVISPIAFALYFLPNTKKWFDKWKSLFFSLLLLFPIISIIFGMSTLTANIVMQVASAQNAQTLALFSLAIQAIPLAVTPLILKSSGQMLGNIGNSIRNNKLFNKARGGAKGAQGTLNNFNKRRALEGKAALGGRTIRAIEKHGSQRKRRKATAQQEQARYISDYINSVEGSGGDKVGFIERTKAGVKNFGKEEGDQDWYDAKTKGEKLQDQMAFIGDEGGKDRAKAYALSSQHKMLSDEIKAHNLVMPGEEAARRINEKAASNDDSLDAETSVQVQAVADADNAQTTKKVIELSGVTMNGAQRSDTVNRLAKTSTYLQHPTAQHMIKTGQVKNEEDFHKNVVEPNILEGTFSAARIGGMSNEDRQILYTAYESGHLSDTAKAHIEDAAREAVGNSKVSKKLENSDMQKLGNIGANRTPSSS